MAFNLDEAIKIANKIVFANFYRSLSDIEIIILKGAWEREEYDQIAAKNQYATSYISQDIAPKLWNLLTDALGEKVKKSNFKEALKRCWEKQLPPEYCLESSESTIVNNQQHNGKPFEATVPPYLSQTKHNFPASELYVERFWIEFLCYETLLQPGSLIRIKAPKLMGKTSLMERVLVKVAKQGYRTVNLSLEMADRKTHFTNLNKFLRWFCLNLSRELGLPNQLDSYWDEEGMGAKVSCTTYLEEYLLTANDSPLILFLDDVDVLFPYPEVYEDFFGLLRSWYEKARSRENWKKVRLAIATEFCPPQEGEERQWIEQIVQNQIIKNWEAQDEPEHLRTIRDRLLRNTPKSRQLLQLYQQILQQGTIPAQNSPEYLELRLSGLVTQHQGSLAVKNLIYARVFNLDWVNQKLALELANSKIVTTDLTLMFAGIVAFTPEMLVNQQYLDIVQQNWQQMRQYCQQFGGQVLKSFENGLLFSFESAEKAVDSAIEMQKALAIAATNLLKPDKLLYQIGIHLGEVFFKDNDVLGKGVDLVAQLHTQAEPGGICLSQTVYDQVKHLLQVNAVNLGQYKLKDISEPAFLYHISPYHPVLSKNTDNSLNFPSYPSGAVPLDSPFYVERAAVETQICQEIKKSGALVRIKAPREMGKTSLLLRTLDYAARQGYHTVSLNLEQIDDVILNDLNRFLRWLCANVTRQLHLEPKLEEYWDEDIGSKISCSLYFRNYLLKQIDTPLVLSLDEVQYIFEHPLVAKDVLPLFRSWYEEAKREPIWQKLRLIIVHSTEIYVPLQLKQSPFNVGLPIDLSSFNVEQVQQLAQRYGLNWTDTQQATELMALLEGHPALVHTAIYHLSRGKITFAQFLHTAATPSGIYSHHLQRHQVTLQEQPELAKALDIVINSQQPISLDSSMTYKLISMGVIKQLRDKVIPTCELYRQYFTSRNSKL